MKNKLEEIRDYAKREFADQEVCNVYYDTRYLEFITYFEEYFSTGKKLRKVLEVGCGMGFQSAFLSTIAEEVVATDLANSTQTVYNFTNARKLISGLGIENVSFQHASVEELPFEEKSFDMVYCSHVLPCCPNPELAIKEMNRVLKPGGMIFCVVPTRATAIYRLFEYYIYLIKRVVNHSLVKPLAIFANKTAGVNSQTKPQNPETAPKRSALDCFPFPNSIGTVHWKDEYASWHYKTWRNLIAKQSNFTLVSQQASQMPWGYYLSIFFPKLSFVQYRLTRKMEFALGKHDFFQKIAMNSILVATRS